MSPALPVERRTDPERLASLETGLENLSGWVQAIDTNLEDFKEKVGGQVTELRVSFGQGAVKLDTILKMIERVAEEQRLQNDAIRRQADEQTRQGEEVRQHMGREEAQMTGMIRRIESLHDEIVDGDTRVMSAFLQANTESKDDRRTIWDAIKKFHGPEAHPQADQHWAVQFVNGVRKHVIDKGSLLVALIVIAYAVNSINEDKEFKKTVQAQLERVVPK